MPQFGATPFAFPDFHGATRRLVLVNLGAYFALALAQLAVPGTASNLVALFAFVPNSFADGAFWQPLTYSLIHPSLLGTLLELLSLWFLAGFLEQLHSASWIFGLYITSVLGMAAAATALYAGGIAFGHPQPQVLLIGCFGGIFGLLTAIGVLHGDTQFLLLFTIGIKARYLVAIYALIALAGLFGGSRMYAFAQLGGALAGLIYIRVAPRRGVSFLFSERWYALRNGYYRWKRRRAARKFEVYMRKQGRTVRFDGQGRLIDEDHDDKKRWN